MQFKELYEIYYIMWPLVSIHTQKVKRKSIALIPTIQV